MQEQITNTSLWSSLWLDGDWPNSCPQFKTRSTHQTDVRFHLRPMDSELFKATAKTLDGLSRKIGDAVPSRHPT